MSKDKEAKKSYIVIIIVAFIFVGAFVLSIVNKLSKSVPDNPKGTVGNTAGNIYNSGLFCESDGKVYFANSYDQNSLYSMNPDGSDIKKILSAKVKYINAGGNYLYYYMSDSQTSTGLGFIRRVMGICRCKKNGKAMETLTRYPSLEMILIDNNLYYQHYDNQTAVSLHKIDTEGKNDIGISKDIINPAGVYNDVIYYANQTDNHFLMVLDTSNDSMTEYVRHNVWNPIRQGNYIYFIDLSENHKLARYNIESENIELLSSERVDCYNLNTEYVIYQTNNSDSSALKRLSLDGFVEETIMDGTYTSINMTSNYVYFSPFENQEITYKTPAYGSISVTEFDAAKLAVSIK